MRLLTIVPFSRPSMLRNVVRNYENQTFRSDIAVVENGSGVGVSSAMGFRPTVLLRSADHQSTAKNTALEWGIKNGYTHFSTNDDDDYYGDHYTSELMTALSDGHDIVGKLDGFIRMSDRNLYYQDCGGHNGEVPGVHGPTISGAIYPDMPRFREDIEWGEDWEWIQESITLGKRVYATSPNNFCYMRMGSSHNHAYPHSDEQFMAFSAARFWSCGRFNEDVVNGKLRPRMVEATKPELPFTENPAYQAVMRA